MHNRARVCLYTMLVIAIHISSQVWAASPQDIASEGRKAAVFLNVESTDKTGMPNPPSYGSGFVVNPDGFVLTASHLIPKDIIGSPVIYGSIESRFAAKEEMELIARHPIYDAALLKFKNTANVRQYVKIGDGAELRVGDALYAIGFPLLTEFGFKNGLLAGTGGPGGTWITNILLNPGDSGGPVYNTNGQVMALVTNAQPNAQGINFVLPLALIKDFLPHGGIISPASSTQTATAEQQKPIVERIRVDQTRQATNELVPTSRIYNEAPFVARPGYRIYRAELVRQSDNNLSDVVIDVSDDRKSASLSFRLTSGPLYDRYRGWLVGEMVIHLIPDN